MSVEGEKIEEKYNCLKFHLPHGDALIFLSNRSNHFSYSRFAEKLFAGDQLEDEGASFPVEHCRDITRTNIQPLKHLK